MQDFAERLREARSGPNVRYGQEGAGQQHRHPIDVFANGYTLGYQQGAQDRDPEVEAAREAARALGFDAGVRELLVLTLLALQEVAGELESRRAHKVMLEKARERLNEVVEQLGHVAVLLPPDVAGQTMMDLSGNSFAAAVAAQTERMPDA